MTAVVEMVFTGSLDVSDVVRSHTVGWIENVTQAEYDLLPVPDPRTIYIVQP